MHSSVHPQAGEVITVKNPKGIDWKTGPTQEFVVEDWWDRLGQGTWREGCLAGNFACTNYAERAETDLDVLPDDEVVYGKINGLGYLLHVTELGDPTYATNQKDTGKLLVTLLREGADVLDKVIDRWDTEDNPVQKLALDLLCNEGEQVAKVAEAIEALTNPDTGLTELLGELGSFLSSTFGDKVSAGDKPGDHI